MFPENLEISRLANLVCDWFVPVLSAHLHVIKHKMSANGRKMNCIAAMARNRGIGNNGKLPWKLKLVFTYSCIYLLFTLLYNDRKIGVLTAILDICRLYLS